MSLVYTTHAHMHIYPNRIELRGSQGHAYLNRETESITLYSLNPLAGEKKWTDVLLSMSLNYGG